MLEPHLGGACKPAVSSIINSGSSFHPLSMLDQIYLAMIKRRPAKVPASCTFS
jgi:hypothetical protein